MTKTKRRGMGEIASDINRHLRRFEADPVINSRPESGGITKRFYNAGAYYGGGAKINVSYMSFQGSTALSRFEAEQYLRALDNGYVGPHFACFREIASKRTIDFIKLRGLAMKVAPGVYKYVFGSVAQAAAGNTDEAYSAWLDKFKADAKDFGAEVEVEAGNLALVWRDS